MAVQYDHEIMLPCVSPMCISLPIKRAISMSEAASYDEGKPVSVEGSRSSILHSVCISCKPYFCAAVKALVRVVIKALLLPKVQ